MGDEDGDSESDTDHEHHETTKQPSLTQKAPSKKKRWAGKGDGAMQHLMISLTLSPAMKITKKNLYLGTIKISKTESSMRKSRRS